MSCERYKAIYELCTCLSGTNVQGSAALPSELISNKHCGDGDAGRLLSWVVPFFCKEPRTKASESECQMFLCVTGDDFRSTYTYVIVHILFPNA